MTLVQLSSLDQIRGFVAVGRRMSITLAAQDLCLTQSAVSRQIQALEEQLGVKLLTRSYRSIAFTPEGERLFRSADGVVQQLQDVMGDLRATGAERPVMLSASIGVTGLWLLPKLNEFQKLYPNVDLRISANNRLSDMRNDGIDLVVRYCAESSVPAGSQYLFGESIAPVAHPALGAELEKGLQGQSDWSLLELDDPHHRWLQWKSWLSEEEWANSKPHGILHFNHYDQVIQAALAGQGIALGRLELVQSLIQEGRLTVIAPPRRRDESTHAYWLIQADQNPRKDVKQVVSWIIRHAADTEAWVRT